MFLNRIELREIAKVNLRTLDKHFPHGSIRYIDISAVAEGYISTFPNEIDLKSAPSRARRLVSSGDTVISTVRPANRAMFFAAEPGPDWVVSTGFAVLTPIVEKVLPRFLFYSVFNPGFTALLVAHEKGAAYPAVSVEDILGVNVCLPSLDEQASICDLLGALDDKIESLQKSVRLAQDLAQSTFKAWFVSGEHWGGQVPSDWKAGKLKDICELRRDAVKAGQFTDLPYVPVDTLQMKNLAVHSWKPNSEAQSSLVRFEEDDILIGAMRVYFHRVAIAPFAGLTRTTAFTLRPKRKSYLPFTLLLCNEETTIEFAQTTSKGSTMPYAVWEGGLASMDVLLPTEEVLEDFARSVAPLIDFVKESGKQLQALSDLRDFLLPQLLSGRIRVGEDFA